MKPRHAAALALVGWYLMAPPSHQVAGQKELWTSAPLANWSMLGMFDSEADCKRGVHDRSRLILMDGGSTKKFVEALQCIESHDPRLNPDLLN